jgi:hypothetical protein
VGFVLSLTLLAGKGLTCLSWFRAGAGKPLNVRAAITFRAGAVGIGWESLTMVMATSVMGAVESVRKRRPQTNASTELRHY